MNAPLADWLSFWSESLVRASWQAALAIGVAWLIETSWRSMPAAWRSWMWRLVFLKTALALVSVSVDLPLLPASVPPARFTGEALDSHFAGTTPPVIVAEASSTTPTPFLTLLLFLVWALGLAAWVGAWWWDVRCLRRRLADSRPIVEAHSLRMMRCLAERMQIACPQLRSLSDDTSPCLAGFRHRPILGLPATWLGQCPPEQLRLAIAHELAHFARNDLGWNRFVALCRGVLFFHPLLWFATRRYVTAQELACDALALQHTQAAPAHLAHMLVQFAERPLAGWVGAVAMTGTYSHTKERITAMFHVSQSPPRCAAQGLFLVGLVCLLPVSLSAQSSSTLRDENPRPQRTNGMQRAFASSSASASAGGYARGLGFGNQAGPGFGYGNPRSGFGNGLSNAWGYAQAQASVGSFDPVQRYDEQPPTSSNNFDPRSRRSASSMRQSMTSTGTDNGQSWSRSTQATLKGDTVTIEETQNQITVTVERSDGTRQQTRAHDLQELSAQSPEAADLYRKLLPPHSQSNSWGANTDAQQMLREQISAMQAQPGVRGNPLEALLNDLLRQLD